MRWLTNPLHLLPVNLLLSLGMIVALHGSSAFKILLILTVNYSIAKHCRGSWFSPVLTWTFNGLVLFINDLYHGYQFSSLGSSLSFLVSLHRCISNATLIFFFFGRIASRACILVGMLYLILRCFDSSRLIWTTIGHARIQKM